MRDDASRLLDIVLACRHALEAVEGVTHEQFRSRRPINAAAIHELGIIGEAANAISEQFKSRHPEIEWQAIIALRHRIVHEYFRVDLKVIWQILHNDVPVLLRLIEPLVPPDDTLNSS